jgi:hypothetical protein
VENLEEHPHPIQETAVETLKADAEVTTLEAAQVAVVAIMIVDHMTEVAIVTAMIRVAVVVEATAAVVAAEAVGQLPMGSNATTAGIAAEVAEATVGRTFITAPARAVAIPVGRNHPQVAEASPGMAATAEAITAATMAVVAAAALKTGPSPCPGTIGSKLSSSRAVTGPRVSTLIDMRTFRSRPLDQMCQMALKISASVI